jgi:hypothetical protein
VGEEANAGGPRYGSLTEAVEPEKPPRLQKLIRINHRGWHRTYTLRWTSVRPTLSSSELMGCELEQRDDGPLAAAACCKNDYGTDNLNGEMVGRVDVSVGGANRCDVFHSPEILIAWFHPWATGPCPPDAQASASDRKPAPPSRFSRSTELMPLLVEQPSAASCPDSCTAAQC